MINIFNTLRLQSHSGETQHFKEWVNILASRGENLTFCLQNSICTDGPAYLPSLVSTFIIHKWKVYCSNFLSTLSDFIDDKCVIHYLCGFKGGGGVVNIQRASSIKGLKWPLWKTGSEVKYVPRRCIFCRSFVLFMFCVCVLIHI